MSETAEPKQTLPDKQQAELAALGIDGTPSATSQRAYSLDDFLPVLMNLLVPRIALASAPTFVPKTLVDSIQFVDDGSTKSLYLYINKAWQQFSQANAVTQLVAGLGISLSPLGGTGAVTVTNAGVRQLVAGAGISLSPGGGTGVVTVTNSSTLTPPEFYLHTRGGSDASGDTFFSHSLGRVPNYAKFTARLGFATPAIYTSDGSYDGTNMVYVATWSIATSTGGSAGGTDAVISISDHGGNSQIATCVFDASTVTLQWSKGGSGLGGTIQINCEVG